MVMLLPSYVEASPISEAQIHRQGACDCCEVGIGEATDLAFDAQNVNRLHVINHRLRRQLQTIAGRWLHRDPQRGRQRAGERQQEW
jgi:hypothetical protein